MYDIIIIGGGPGGYVAAVRAAQLKLNTALVEIGELGGVCLNRGCIPAKSLLHAAGIVKSMEESAAFGIKAGSIEIDYARVIANKDSQVKTLTGGVRHLLKKNGVAVYKGEADIVSADTVMVGGQKLQCRHIVIAAGSSPVLPPIPGIGNKNVITSNEALSLKEIPKTMAVIGGGVIGVEMAFAFRRFGCKVSIVEMEPGIVPNMDADVARGLEAILRKEGVAVHTGVKVSEIRPGSIVYQAGDRQAEIPAEKVLAATGRAPDGLSLSLDKAGIAHTKGCIHVDSYLRTSLPSVFAIGDVNGKYMLAHVASAEGIRVVEGIAGAARPMDYTAVPQCIYTEPEAAAAGLTEDQAIKQGFDIKVSRVPVTANGKSLVEGCAAGFSKIVADKKTNRILGLHILAPHASEMIAQGVSAIQYKASAQEIAQLIFPHPSVSELLLESALGIAAHPIHV